MGVRSRLPHTLPLCCAVLTSFLLLPEEVSLPWDSLAWSLFPQCLHP